MVVKFHQNYSQSWSKIKKNLFLKSQLYYMLQEFIFWGMSVLVFVHNFSRCHSNKKNPPKELVSKHVIIWKTDLKIEAQKGFE